ncbi:hypothetical protein GFY24_29700 [Nocardia sp. SYP-A9097]|nr:hypothetical protein [Nocardia sp. SYP-A9097]
MSVKSFAVHSISRGEYEQLVHRGRAGAVPGIESSPVMAQWRAEHPDWRGRHWTFIADDREVLRLRPLNVTRAERRPIAA